MTFLAPGFLYAAIAVALATVALHLLATRAPRAVMLPTVRFVPAAETRAVVRVTRFSDPWLLALRLLLLLLAGAALARPVRVPQRERIARVIVADRSGAVASDAEVRDSVRALYRPGDALASFDSSARYTGAPDSLAPDSLASNALASSSPPSPAPVTGSLSAALVQAHAAASRIREGADSIELVVVSPLAPVEADRATRRIRATWPGRARLVHVGADTGRRPTSPPAVTWRVAARPPRAVARQSPDTVGAVVAGADVLVAPFARRWRYPPDSLRGATTVARWVDGEPAAIEWQRAGATGAAGAACTRSAAIPIDSTGDLVLRPEFLALRARLLGPCDGVSAPAAAPSAARLAQLIRGSGALARASAFPPGPAAPSSLAPWLLAAAIMAALAELVLRHRRRGATS